MSKGAITFPRIGSVAEYQDDKNNCSYDVFIDEGSFYVNGRISNFWHWRKVKKDGSLGKQKSGYGSFRESRNEYKIIIKVSKVS